MRYHISPSTGRPNQCHAEKRACPVGGEHYDTKEAARKDIESIAKGENSIFPVLKKTVYNPAEEDPLTRKDRFKNLMDIDLDNLSHWDLASEISSELRMYAESEYPGCEGCQEQTDYCRCRVYTGAIEVDGAQMATDFFRMYRKNRNVKYGVYTDDERKLISEINEIFDKHEITDLSGYEVESSNDYYGEEIDNIRVLNVDKFYALHTELKEIFDS